MYTPTMLVHRLLSTDVVRDLWLASVPVDLCAAQYCFWPASTACHSWTWVPAHYIAGIAHLLLWEKYALAWLRFMKDPVFQDLVQGICLRWSCLNWLKMTGKEYCWWAHAPSYCQEKYPLEWLGFKEDTVLWVAVFANLVQRSNRNVVSMLFRWLLRSNVFELDDCLME